MALSSPCWPQPELKAVAQRKALPIGWSKWSIHQYQARLYVPLPSGRCFYFYYDGNTSQGIAFNGLLYDGKILPSACWIHLMCNDDGPQLVHVATDGETYGHHHKHGDMALAYSLDFIHNDERAEVTNYAWFKLVSANWRNADSWKHFVELLPWCGALAFKLRAATPVENQNGINNGANRCASFLRLASRYSWQISMWLQNIWKGPVGSP